MVKKIFYTCLLSFIFILLTVTVFAQAPNSTDLFEDVSDVPVDGGIALLIAGGVGFGVKKLYERKQK